jgi:hypothetical protein
MNKMVHPVTQRITSAAACLALATAGIGLVGCDDGDSSVGEELNDAAGEIEDAGENVADEAEETAEEIEEEVDG